MNLLEILKNKLNSISEEERDLLLLKLAEKLNGDELMELLDVSVNDAFYFDQRKATTFFSNFNKGNYYFIEELDIDNYLYDPLDDEPYMYYANTSFLDELNKYNYLANKLYTLKDYKRSFFLFDLLINTEYSIKEIDNGFESLGYGGLDDVGALDSYIYDYESKYAYLILKTKPQNSQKLLLKYYYYFHDKKIDQIFKENNDEFANYKEVVLKTINYVLKSKPLNVFLGSIYNIVKRLDPNNLASFCKQYVKDYPRLLLYYGEETKNAVLIEEALTIINDEKIKF